MTGLRSFVSERLAAEVRPEIAEAARVIAARLEGVAVLFYGSVLRSGDLSGLLDFYVLTDGVRTRGPRALATRMLWPDISFETVLLGDVELRAKVATMPLARFAEAAKGELIDTTIWTRFVQPSALVWCADESVKQTVETAVIDAAVTAARFAAVLGPEQGRAADYWTALFRETYRAEFRVEKPGREAQILAFDPDHFERLLPLAWAGAGIAFEAVEGGLRPEIAPAERRRLLRGWARRRRAGRPRNLARLVKAAFLLDGAGDYALWKIRRHTGVAVTLSPWGARHPLLAAPGVLWRVRKAQRRAASCPSPR